VHVDYLISHCEFIIDEFLNPNFLIAINSKIKSLKHFRNSVF
jgi:hypothetical protein